MHTIHDERFRIHYNPDLSGEVIINDTAEPHTEITLPGRLLKIILNEHDAMMTGYKECSEPKVPKPETIPGRPVRKEPECTCLDPTEHYDAAMLACPIHGQTRTGEPKCTCKAAQRIYEGAFQMVQEVGSMKALESANKCFEAAMEAMNNCPVHGKQKGIPCPKCGHALTRMWMTDGTRVIGHYCPVCEKAVYVSFDVVGVQGGYLGTHKTIQEAINNGGERK